MGWKDGFIEWNKDGTVYLSVVFSWQLAVAHQRAVWYAAQGYDVQAGGPAVLLNPDYLSDVAKINGNNVVALHRHNPNATRTSLGCPRKCPFCAVPKIEGDLQELNSWEPLPLVCDNNLLACSRRHFDRVVDQLKPVRAIDFNQGLDCRMLTWHHAQRLAELDLHAVRLAWDYVEIESQFLRACNLLRRAGIPKRLIRVYVLIGFDDTPDEALYRLEKIRALGFTTNPMRYQPLDAIRRDSYIAPGWTNRELKRFMRYWSRQRWFGSIPFNEFRG